MQGYRKIHAAKVRAARRKLCRKQARWRELYEMTERAKGKAAA